MFSYLEMEVGDAVTPATLHDFCAGSAEMMAWLSSKGVPFHGSLSPDKTSYPGNRHYLYYSGSERSFAHIAAPAPRGHRAVGRGTSGRVLFARLAAAVGSAGALVITHTPAMHIVNSEAIRGIEIALHSNGGPPCSARHHHPHGATRATKRIPLDRG